MSELNLPDSLERARRRFATEGRRSRSDKGRARLEPVLEAELQRLLSKPDKPVMSGLQRKLKAFAAARGLRPPSRSSLYNALDRVPVPSWPVSSLPPAVRHALYNLDSCPGRATEAVIPGDQIAFYAFNYGTLGAVSFAAQLPWICLRRALERRGWRPKSRALLVAAMQYRDTSG